MAITVENGTGLTNADALISLVYFKEYHDARGNDYSAYADAALEKAIVRATDFMSESHHWAGYKLKERGHQDGEQALAWPRTYVVDRNGYSVDIDVVPTEVQKATAEVALYEAGTPGGMQPTYVAHDRVKSEKVGPLATEYDLSRKDAEGARPVLLIVRDLIGQFLAKGANNRLAGTAVRA